MPRVYYNEFDPLLCKWLEQLMREGHIPEGHIDGRSIVDVGSEDLDEFDQCHFFAGIGGWPLALKLAGWGDEPVWTGSCPCQPFSSAGKRRGTDDERHLWPAFARLIEVGQPPTVLGEQVASKAGREWLSGVFTDLEGMGYAGAGADLCAASIGAPHIRQRLVWVADRDPQGCGSRSESDGESEPLAEQSGDDSRRCDGVRDRVANASGGGFAVVRDAPCSRGRGHVDGGGQVHRRLGNAEHQDGRAGIGGEQDEAGVGRHRLTDSERDGKRLGDTVCEQLRAADGDARVSEGERSEQGLQRERRRPHDRESGRGRAGLGDRLGSGLQGHPGDGNRRDQPGRIDPNEARSASSTGFDRHWFDGVGLIECHEPTRDGGIAVKFRRAPTQPGLFPLAHGVSGRVAVVRPGVDPQAASKDEVRSVNRAGALKGSGNAVVPALMAEFVLAYMEARS